MKAQSDQSKASEKDFDTHFKIFYELMPSKVDEILLVSSPYDAFIMEEDGSITSRIINEYRGLNLSRPPRLTLASSAQEALDIIEKKSINLVITMPNLNDMDAFSMGIRIKSMRPDLPIILLGHSTRSVYTEPDGVCRVGIDKIFVWSGDADLLLALVKSTEDLLNVEFDTNLAMVRVLILVEDSPIYRSTFLPLIYKEVVRQTQAVLYDSLNEEHRLLKMRARPKILIAENYEEAMGLYKKYRDYVFGVISDTRFPRNCRMDDTAGIELLDYIKDDIPHLPLLLLSSDPQNREKAAQIDVEFIDKNSENLLSELQAFFLNYLGFGDFIFRLKNCEEVGRASNLRELEEVLPKIPDEPIIYHAKRHRFSNWLMARSEIRLASKFRKVELCDFNNVGEVRDYIISNIRDLRKRRQQGIVTHFSANDFDPDIMDFVKIGKGSLGGKARGLAFMSTQLPKDSEICKRFPDINIIIPKTVVISTEGFDSFVEQNRLKYLIMGTYTDEEIADSFFQADMPDSILKNLKAIIQQVTTPLSIRSSSLLEDAQFRPYAGLYSTYMIPNNHPNFAVRLRQLVTAIKLVYASTYFEGPRSFARSTSQQFKEDSMAVIIQQLAGNSYGDYFYPTLSGVAQSHNFYPISYMKPDDGIAHIAMGLGKIVVEGERTLRFSPKYPNILPQFSTVDDILENCQRHFYALKIKNYSESLNFEMDSNLERLDLDEAEDDFPVKALASTYIPEEHRIRDTAYAAGPKVLTFAQILKYDSFPLPELLSQLLDLGKNGMGCPVEIEFSVNIPQKKGQKIDFFFLQMRPMAGEGDRVKVQISDQEIKSAFCFSNHALGNGKNQNISDIVYVKPQAFEITETLNIAKEIRLVNAKLVSQNRPYLLVGPGRWGSADRFLGIPVQWRDISGVGAIIELRNESLKADPSQGSHFFQNITSLGIHYITVNEGAEDFFKWEWVNSLAKVEENHFLRHVRLEQNFMLKIDGRASQCVMVAN